MSPGERKLIQDALDAFALIQPRFASAAKAAANYLPTTPAKLLEIDQGGDLAVTSFLKRFEQTEDLSARMLRALLAFDQEDTRVMSNRDVAETVAARGLVPSFATWWQIVKLRNELVHEYPADLDTRVERVNKAWQYYEALRAIADTVIRELTAAIEGDRE